MRITGISTQLDMSTLRNVDRMRWSGGSVRGARSPETPMKASETAARLHVRGSRGTEGSAHSAAHLRIFRFVLFYFIFLSSWLNRPCCLVRDAICLAFMSHVCLTEPIYTERHKWSFCVNGGLLRLSENREKDECRQSTSLLFLFNYFAEEVCVSFNVSFH